MKISRTRIALTGLAGAGALLAATLAAGPAFAAGPGCSPSAPNCEVDGSVTVLASITLTMPTTTFSDGTLTAGSSSPLPSGPAFSASVVSSDTHGYALTAVAGTDFTAPNSDTFAASSLTLYQPGTSQAGSCQGGNEWQSSCGETSATLPEPGATPVTLDSNAGATTGDNFSFGTAVAVPLTAGAGAYTVPVLFAAIGA